MPLSTRFLNSGYQFYWWRKAREAGENDVMPKVTHRHDNTAERYIVGVHYLRITISLTAENVETKRGGLGIHIFVLVPNHGLDFHRFLCLLFLCLEN
jgi:hypothetical protein